ncbi:hypothetical protein Rsub_05335 [Raphidocelis subcapitata]|uniref:Right handed beta helix domain-containing protein n=1 Tax=Raphidocelis subcapitata TaxID=307507 RepID=A0A2V0P002_9CHLO|nr:hypothetical protein Rsub_05335 [Raphidocelis subcapitata]|eukprot:GBF92252.1 hypothetical protein Rsub_05335 [Raphidocelis subcapitata]
MKTSPYPAEYGAGTPAPRRTPARTAARDGRPTAPSRRGSGWALALALAAAAAAAARAAAPPVNPPCQPSGAGTDYVVGPDPGQLATLAEVPWEALGPGDTVRIHWQATPYLGKLLLMAEGTAERPVRLCGVPGPKGERPIINGAGATSRAALGPHYASSDYDRKYHEGRSVVVIKSSAQADWTSCPSHIRIDGLEIRNAHPSRSFTDTAGVKRRYEAFGACVWVDRGHNVTLAFNRIRGCSQAVFSKSTDDGDFAVTRDLTLQANEFIGNGVAGADTMHTTYLQSVGLLLEFNHYYPLSAGAAGNAIKDRSVGTVIRYNRIEGGAHSIDLVEAEDYPQTALADPRYRRAYVYGNQIVKPGGTGSAVHYGGDHYTAQRNDTWGEPIFRRGTLYFFHNTLRLTGGEGVVFQLSTTKEQAQVWNNVVIFDAGTQWMRWRASSEVGPPWTPGGVVRLGRNWVNAGWVDSDEWHHVPGQLLGTELLVTGDAPPVNLTTWAPLPGGAAVDAGQAAPPGVSLHPVRWQLDRLARAQPRKVKGAAADLGAVEL